MLHIFAVALISLERFSEFFSKFYLLVYISELCGTKVNKVEGFSILINPKVLLLLTLGTSAVYLNSASAYMHH